MPRPTRAYGRPGTGVIPANWAASHRPTVEKTMVGATVELAHPGTTQDWVNEQMVEIPNPPYWTGPARIQELATRDQSDVTVGEDFEVSLRYLVVVPAGVDASVDDLATVTEVDDAHLVGRSLLVAAVTAGSLRFERDLYCALTD